MTAEHRPKTNPVSNQLEISTFSPEETGQLGAVIGRCLQPGTLVTLDGTLGSGKTCLVQSIAESLGIDRLAVTSPSFSLVQQHVGKLPLVHVDVWRIRDDDEFQELGIDELLDGEAIVLIEWAEKVSASLPTDRLAIAITVCGDLDRKYSISWPSGTGAAAMTGVAIRRETRTGHNK